MFNYPNSNPYLNNYSNSNQQHQIQYPMTPLTFVNGFEGAKGYIMPLNSTMYFKDSDSDKMFIKSCDSMGRTFLKTYKLVEILENDQTVQSKQEEFVKISDFKALQEDFNNLKSLITQVKENKGVEQ